MSSKMERRIENDLLTLIRETPFDMGDRLPAERELARRFKTSRHTLRSALRRLEAGGILEIRAGSGCYVISTDNLSPRGQVGGRHDAPETPEGHLEARYVLEPEIAGLAAAKTKSEDIGDLENGLMRISRAMMTGGREAIAAEHRQFQNRIAACTRNPQLEQVGRQLAEQRRVFCRTLGCMDKSAQEVLFSACVAIVNAIKKGDAALARARMREFVRQDARLMVAGGHITLPEIIRQDLGDMTF